jgi:hypothetical protein
LGIQTSDHLCGASGGIHRLDIDVYAGVTELAQKLLERHELAAMAQPHALQRCPVELCDLLGSIGYTSQIDIMTDHDNAIAASPNVDLEVGCTDLQRSSKRQLSVFV